MADVSALRGDDRGQFVLAFAMAIAIVFVVLALFLNTAIYTENIATRKSDVTGAGDAVKYRDAAADTTREVMDYANRNNNSSYVELHERVTGTVDNWGAMTSELRLRQARSANLSVRGTNNGTRIVQRADDDFTNVSGNEDWALVNGTEHVRAFRLNVTKSSLSGAIVGAANFSSPFRVTFHGAGGGVWEVRVYEHFPTGTMRVAVVDGSGTPYGPCSTSESRAVIDITGATVAGEHCPALTFLDNLSRPMDITYNVSSNVDGTYELVVSKRNVDGGAYGSSSEHYGAEGSASHPFRTKAVYATTIDVHYRTARVHYETVLRIAPGEQE